MLPYLAHLTAEVVDYSMSLYVVYAFATTIVFPSVVGLTMYKNLHQSFRAITWLLVIGMITEAVMIVFSVLHINNLFAIHFFALVEIIFISLYFYLLIQNRAMRKTIIFGVLCLSIFAIIYAVNGNNIAEFNSLPRAMECVYFSALGGWLFYEMSGDPKPIDGSHYFINGTIFFYFTSCFLIFTFSKYQAANYDVIVAMFDAHVYVNALCNLAYAMGLWTASKRYYIQS